MAYILTVNDALNEKEVKLTKGMIVGIKENQNGTARIILSGEGVIFDTKEPYDWVRDAYNDLY